MTLDILLRALLGSGNVDALEIARESGAKIDVALRVGLRGIYGFLGLLEEIEDSVALDGVDGSEEDNPPKAIANCASKAALIS